MTKKREILRHLNMDLRKEVIMEELFINRQDWIRGDQRYGMFSALLRASDQKMCCLGFYLRSCGIEEMADYSSPGHLHSNYTDEQRASNPIPEWLLQSASNFTFDRNESQDGRNNTLDCQRLMDINDSPDPELTEEQREKEIKELFLLHGVKVTFVD